MKVTQEQIEEAARKPLKYFSHTAHAAEENESRRLLRRCGYEGYGRYWRLCELMAAAEGHALDVRNAEDQDILADLLDFKSTEELGDFLVTLSGCGLVDMPGDGTVTARVVTETALYFGKKRASGGKGGRNRGKAQGA